MKNIFLFAAALLIVATASAQFNQAWKGKKCAVVLTYDDAINEHLDNAVPVLDSLGLKATFYITGFSPSMQTRLTDWKKMAAKGYELGNHTLYHPCNGGAGREWVPKEYELDHYSIRRMVDETRTNNVLLQAIDGKTKRTFAYTCGEMKIGDSSFINAMKNDFVAARAVRNEMHTIDKIDLYNTDCYMVNNNTADEMIGWVKKAQESGSMLVILFHGVGGGNGLNVALEEHRRFLSYLKQNEKDIWIAPMIDVAEHVKEWQERDRLSKAIQKATSDDHKDMLAQLKITSLRPGPSGNPAAPNAANADESKASPYTSLPDPLLLKNGTKVTTVAAWWKKRRPEIVSDFENEVYGVVPKNTPAVKWEVTSTTDTVIGGIAAVTKNLTGHVDNSLYPAINVNIQLNYTAPKNSTIPVPVIIEYGFIFPAGFRMPAAPAGAPVQKSGVQQALEKGWAFAVIVPTSYQADNGAGLTEGIIGLCNKGQRRKPQQWGTLRAWAWGASRAIDYFETDKNIDTKKVVIEGLSRYGKAALVTMAFEPRVAIGFIGSSGAGGAKILRRVYGEQVENLASSGEYHWFAGNFIKYAGPLTPNDLPVDAHELVALCAPRPVFISSGTPEVEGKWLDIKGMFLGGVHAGPVYTLLSKKDLGITTFPAGQISILDGDIAFRQHEGGHTVTPNWPYFLNYAERYFK